MLDIPHISTLPQPSLPYRALCARAAPKNTCLGQADGRVKSVHTKQEWTALYNFCLAFQNSTTSRFYCLEVDGTFSLLLLSTSWPEAAIPSSAQGPLGSSTRSDKAHGVPSPAVRWERARRCPPSYSTVLPPGNFPSWVLSQKCAFVFNDLSEVPLLSCASVSPAAEQKKKKGCHSFIRIS